MPSGAELTANGITQWQGTVHSRGSPHQCCAGIHTHMELESAVVPQQVRSTCKAAPDEAV